MTFLDYFKSVASQNLGEGCLSQLDLSHNLLSIVDKQRLADDWHSNCSGESSACLEHTLCLFTKQ